MSHKAVNWALEQRHLKPGPWIVLIQLGDRHNKDTLQVSPCQNTICEDCNMSRATVNRHLDDLEGLGLVRRVQRQHPVSKKKLNTHYILGLDFKNPPHVEYAVSQNETRKAKGENENIDGNHVSNRDTETMSQKPQKPCLKKGRNHVSNRDINQVNKPVREPCAADAPHMDFDFQDFLRKFCEVYPRVGDLEAVEAELLGAFEAGADPERILSAAGAYADENKGNERRYIAFAENWLRKERWKTHANAAPKADEATVLANLAAAIKSGASWVASTTSAQKARELIAKGLVTETECKAAGIL